MRGGIGTFQEEQNRFDHRLGTDCGAGKVSVEKDGETTELETTYTMLATGSEARSLPGVEIDGEMS